MRSMTLESSEVSRPSPYTGTLCIDMDRGLFHIEGKSGAQPSPHQSLGVFMESLRRWRANADANAGDPGESAELKRLRRENAELRRANEILSSASASFASRLDPTRR